MQVSYFLYTKIINDNELSTTYLESNLFFLLDVSTHINRRLKVSRHRKVYGTTKTMFDVTYLLKENAESFRVYMCIYSDKE